jgi:hypothetical protein
MGKLDDLERRAGRLGFVVSFGLRDASGRTDFDNGYDSLDDLDVDLRALEADLPPLPPAGRQPAETLHLRDRGRRSPYLGSLPGPRQSPPESMDEALASLREMEAWQRRHGDPKVGETLASIGEAVFERRDAAAADRALSSLSPSQAELVPHTIRRWIEHARYRHGR